MLTLAVDTSTPMVSAALVDVIDATTTRVVAQRNELAPNRHGELLAALIDDMRVEARTAAADVRAVVAGVGPGPFTGLRVGVVTATAFADALRVPTYAVVSLDAIARAHRARGPLLVCTDARRRQVYWARYDRAGARVAGPELAPPGELVATSADEPVTAVGAGVLAYADAFAVLSQSVEDAFPSAVDVAVLAAERVHGAAPAECLEPLYLRRPDAVPPAGPKRVIPA